MESREHFEQFARGLAVRRHRAEDMSRALQRHAVAEFEAERESWRVVDPRPVSAAVGRRASRRDSSGATLFAEAAALADATIEELGAAEAELVQQNEALFAAQLEMDASGRHYRALFELAPAAYLVTTAAGVILEINRAGERLLGRPRNFAVGKSLALFVAPGDDRAAFHTVIGRLRVEDDTEVWPMRLTSPGQPPVDVAVSVRAARDDDAAAGAAAVSLYWLLRDESGHITDDLL